MKKLSISKKKPENSKNLQSYEQGVGNVQDIFNRFFEDPWFRLPSVFNQGFLDRNSFGDWLPKADISETDTEIKIKMNVPGVDPNQINVEADPNSLVISGSTEEEDEQEGENWYRAEREAGEFRRSFELPNGCDVDNISATTRHGSLFIQIPKKVEATKKKINITNS